MECNNWHLGEQLLDIIKEVYINLKMRGHKKISVELICDIIEMWEIATAEDLPANWRLNGGSDVSFRQDILSRLEDYFGDGLNDQK